MSTPVRGSSGTTLLALVSLASACAPARAGGTRSVPAEPPRAMAAATSGPTSVARLAWMEGRWTGTADGIDMEEHWTSATGGALIGMHKDVKGPRMTSFEFLRIESTPNDGLVYFASPRSAPATPFALVELGEQRAIFENKAHDFPQRIVYWLDGAGALHARVEGTLEGKAGAEEWSWTKQK
jgi:Domain of unknown function (DUF6265)